jgi:hypothetical protein
MQELESHLAKARFSRRHLTKAAGIGLAALVAKATMPKPARAKDCEDDEPGEDEATCFLKGTKIQTITGERKVENLAIGDFLPTHFNGMQPIQWIGRYQFTRSDTSKPWVRDVPSLQTANLCAFIASSTARQLRCMMPTTE